MRQLVMYRANMHDLPPVPPLSQPLHLRVAVHADMDSMADLLAAAFDDPSWTAERVGTSLLDAMDVPTTYVVLDGRKAVATASVQLRNEYTSGYLHWVAVDPVWQGNKLGYHVCLVVLHDFARRKIENVSLKTDDMRLAAIKTYANLGFKGVIHDDDDRMRWSKIAETIPTIELTEPAG